MKKIIAVTEKGKKMRLIDADELKIETIDKKERKISATCSECEAFFSLGLFDFGLCYNYCPNCGAKMDLEGE